MNIGARITLTTTMLVAVSLGSYGWFAMRGRKAELAREFEAQTVAVARLIAGTVEQQLVAEPGEVQELIERLDNGLANADLTAADLQQGQSNGLAPPAANLADAELRIIKLGGLVATNAQALERARRVEIGGRAAMEWISGSPPTLVLAFPLRRAGAIDGVLELRRSAKTMDGALSRSVEHLLFSLGILVATTGIAVWLLVRATISRPLRRMLGEIGEVAKGDLTRTVFAADDDEIGQFAARFNEMTASLREARAQTEQSVKTQLGLEARLGQSEKLATIGLLAAEIAHEVGTPLAVIAGRAGGMTKKATEPEAVSRNAEIILVQTGRISKIIEQLLAFARRGQRGRERIEVDLNRVASEAIDMLEPRIERSGVVVTTNLGMRSSKPGGTALTPGITGDHDALLQVCINLMVNALQATPKGGGLHIATREVTRRKEGLEASPPAPYACLEVSDTGAGVVEEQQSRLFEPFYSTKEDGIGLGLAVSQGIVKDHDGWIEVEPRKEGGTTFRVFLPAAGAAAAASMG